VTTAGAEFGHLTRVVIKHARDAFASDAVISRDWRDLNFTEAPDFSRALAEYDAFAALLASRGAELVPLPAWSETSLDSIYVRDASILSPRGLILCNMGKPQRATEPAAQARAYESLGFPIAGRISRRAELKAATSCGSTSARWRSVAATGPMTRAFGSFATSWATASMR
jgi:N-dimethylarginine dimethylaminohydrolase